MIVNVSLLIVIFALQISKTPLAQARHKVRGSVYEILGLATVQTSDVLKDYDRVFVYRDIDTEEMYVRQDKEFDDGRFEILP